MTPAATKATRPHAPTAIRSALDQAGDDAADDLEDEDPDDGAEVDRAERRDEPAEDAQVGLADVAQEAEHLADVLVVRHAPAEREEHRAEDVRDDQDRVHVQQRAHVARDAVAGVGEDEEGERHEVLRMASIASENAARRPPRSSASSPRAVEPPGEVTLRRTASVSYSRRRMCSAAPAIVWTTSSAAWPGGMPLRTPASTWASTTSA